MLIKYNTRACFLSSNISYINYFLPNNVEPNSNMNGLRFIFHVWFLRACHSYGMFIFLKNNYPSFFLLKVNILNWWSYVFKSFCIYIACMKTNLKDCKYNCCLHRKRKWYWAKMFTIELVSWECLLFRYIFIIRIFGIWNIDIN